jgi:hypothetical protein
MKWQRKNGEVIEVDDYDLFQNGSWIPNAMKLYLATWFPNLLPEYEQQRAEEIANQPNYDNLIDRPLKNPKQSNHQIGRQNIRNTLKSASIKMGDV